MASGDRRAEDEAIAWRLRLRDADGATWTRFAAWLDAEPANADAYALVALDDAEAPELLGRLATGPRAADAIVAAPPRPAAGARRRLGRYAIGVVAAAMIAVVGAHVLVGSATLVATGPGQRRSLALADGSRIEMNGDTRLALDRRRPRTVELVAGEAIFTVRHDAAAPFEVRAGDMRLRDVGTTFDVVRTPGAVDVAVASGAVLVGAGADGVQLAAGDAAHDPDGPGAMSTTHVDPATVGGWREGRLVFTDATLAQVAAAIGRSTGVAITVAPAIAARSFDGVIMVGGNRDALIRRLGPLLGVDVQRIGTAVRLAPLSRAGG